MASEEFLIVLKSIDASLKEILALSRQRTSRAASTGSGAGPLTANDKDLDSQYGDPEVRMKDPRDWTGPTMKGRKFSACPADYLEMYADKLDWMAGKSEDEKAMTKGNKPLAPYQRKDAARARGWAARIRSGKHTPPPVDSSPGWSVTDDDEPAPSI